MATLMTGYEVFEKRNNLERELINALQTFEKKDNIKFLRKQLRELQAECPHFDKTYNFAFVDDCCPYCGKKIVVRE